MEDTTREADWPRRDAFHTAILERDVASGTPSYLRASTGRKRTHKSTIWYPIKWIAINLVLIALLAVLYTKILIPHLQAYWNQESAAKVPPTASRMADTSDMHVPAKVRSAGNMIEPSDQKPARLQRTPAPIQEQRIISKQSAESHGLRCIGGVAYDITIKDGVTIVNSTNARCE